MKTLASEIFNDVPEHLLTRIADNSDLLFEELFKDTQRALARVDVEFSRKAAENTQLYVDPVVGNDENDGSQLTVGTDGVGPLATVAKALEVAPDRFEDYNGTINVKGPCNELFIDISRYTALGHKFLINGLDDPAVVFDDGGSNFVADTGTLNTLGRATPTLGMTPNEWRGYMLQVLSGPCAGQHRNIKSHDADVFTLEANFSQLPGPAEFRVVRMGTEFTQCLFTMRNGGHGEVALQNVHFSGTSFVQIPQSVGQTTLSHCTFGNNNVSPAPPVSGTQFLCQESNLCWFRAGKLNPSTWVREEALTDSLFGVGQTAEVAPFGFGFYFLLTKGLNADCSVFRQLVFLKAPYMVVDGLHSNSCWIVDSWQNPWVASTVPVGSADRGGATFGGSAYFPPLLMVNSGASVGAGLDCSGSPAYAGIVMVNTTVNARGNVSGSGNKFGVYGDGGSKWFDKAGLSHTLTGVRGDLSEDNSFAVSWAAAKGAKATGSITVPNQATLTDGKIVTVDDGVNPALVFEIDKDGLGVAPGNVAVNISGDTTDFDVADTFYAAMAAQRAAGKLAIVATDPAGASASIPLIHEVPLAAGNVAITTDDVNITVVGMAGGADLPLNSARFLYNQYAFPIFG